MRIKLFELKKIFTSPILYALLILFIAFNIFTVISSKNERKDLDVLNSLINRFGYKIDNNMLANFKSYYDGEIKSMNALSAQRSSRTYKTAYDFSNDSKNYDTGLYTKEELAKITRLQTVENYYNLASGVEAQYKSIDIKAMGEEMIKRYGLSGAAAQTARGEYRVLAERFEQLKANGEEKNLFYIGQIYSMQSLLFGNIFGIMIFEILLIVVLMTGLSVNYEFDSRAHQVTYASKRGRGLIRDKLFASLIACLAVTTLVMAFTLITFFCVFDYSKLWNVPIGTGFLTESNQMFIPWFNLPFWRYLFACVLLLYAFELVFTGIAFCVAAVIKNNYIVFAMFALLAGLGFIMPNAIPRSSNLIFAASFNPFIMVYGSAVWLMEKGPTADFKYLELITAGAWTALIAILGALLVRRFKRLDLY